MYRINPLQRDVLITADEVVFHAPTKHTLDERAITQAIIIAEESYVREALGSKLYFDIIAQKNQEVTTDNLNDLQMKVNASPQGVSATLVIGQTINALEFLPDNYQKLWKQYLWKLTAECVMQIALPDAFVQFASEGAVLSAPPANPLNAGTVVSPSLSAMKWVMDKKMMNRIDPMREAMHAWLCANKGFYPLYDKHCDCNSEGIPYKRKSQFVLGIYDDDDCDRRKKCFCDEED